MARKVTEDAGGVKRDERVRLLDPPINATVMMPLAPAVAVPLIPSTLPSTFGAAVQTGKFGGGQVKDA